jgi:uncharacterized protein
VNHVVLDTGPLVALLNARDEHHEWARHIFAEITPPLLTCEAVLSEACFLLRKATDGPNNVIELVERGVLNLPFVLSSEVRAVRQLMRRYDSVPMSLADASLVRMTELDARTTVLTADRDFSVYRRNKRQRIPLITPDS